MGLIVKVRMIMNPLMEKKWKLMKEIRYLKKKMKNPMEVTTMKEMDWMLRNYRSFLKKWLILQ